MTNPIVPVIALYVLMAVATIVVMYRGDQPRYLKAKTITSLLFIALAVICWQTGEGGPFPESWMRILPGLVFCLCGDVFLALAHEIDNNLDPKLFRFGVGSFLIAHLFFCFEIMVVLNRYAPQKVLPVIVGLVTVGVSIFCSRSDMYDYKGNARPAILYSFFVGFLCGLGIQLMISMGPTGRWLIMGAGSILFLLSDLTLSNKYFLKKKPKAFGAIVLVTYYAAVACFGLYLL